MKHYSVALYLFDEMRQRGAPIDEYTFNIAIDCYCLMKHVDLGFAVMDFIFKSRFEPSVSTFNTLNRGLFLDPKVADAMRLFLKLSNLRLCEPNDVMIQTLIDKLG